MSTQYNLQDDYFESEENRTIFPSVGYFSHLLQDVDSNDIVPQNASNMQTKETKEQRATIENFSQETLKSRVLFMQVHFRPCKWCLCLGTWSSFQPFLSCAYVCSSLGHMVVFSTVCVAEM